MALQISITIRGDQEVQRKLKKLGSGLNDMRGAMSLIGKNAVNYFETTGMTDRGRPFGEPWPALSQKYKINKEKRWPGRPMLIASGDMSKSFYAKSGANQVVVGNSADYFKYHQSTAPRHKIPRRPMIGINNPIKRMVKEVIKADIEKKIRSA